VQKQSAADGVAGDTSGGVAAAMSPESIPPAWPVPVEPEVTTVGPVEPTREGSDEASDVIETCLLESIHLGPIADSRRGDETNPTPAVVSADETNPIPAVVSADGTNPTLAAVSADETNPILAAASADETNPISAPVAESDDRRNRTSPDVAMLEALLADMGRRAVVLSAAGYPVPIPR
jgi:hypothetical protein